MDRPTIRFARTADEISIAWAEAGSGPEVVFVPVYQSCHVELLPQVMVDLRALADQFHAIWFDFRGTGLSQRPVRDVSYRTQLGDLEAVVEAAGLTRMALIASAQTGPAVRYAVKYPERVTHLILDTPVAVGREYMSQARWRVRRDLALNDWELAVETIAKSLAGLGADAAGEAAFARLLRSATDAETYVAYMDAAMESDISGELPKVAVPTLVLANQTIAGGTMVDGARAVAATIPGAQFALYVGAYTAAGPGWSDLACEFIQSEPAARSHSSVRTDRGAFRTILFTDVVSSTPLLTQLKDAKMRDVMRVHDEVLSTMVAVHGGRVVKTIGDAFMAEFAVPSAAVEAAIAVQRNIRERFAASDVPIRIRIGINAGEPIEEDGDLHGTAVVIAKRLESLAGVDGILVSDVVKQAVAGKDFEFQDRGQLHLKGFDEELRAWWVRWE